MRKLLFIVMTSMIAVSLGAQSLTIIHFNDTHSHIDPLRAGAQQRRGGVIEHAAYVDSVRKADGRRNVLLLHAGDFSQGTSYFPELGGDIEIDVLNATGYDAVALGNHEFDNGISELARRLRRLDVPALCANYDFSGTELEDLLKPYVILRKAGKKIGIIGLLTDISAVVSSEMVRGLEYMEPSPVVNEYAAYLKNERKCDYVICLSHLGFKEDCRLAETVSDVDLIVGGHTHTFLDEIVTVLNPEGKPVSIVQNWQWGLNAANLKVAWN